MNLLKRKTRNKFYKRRTFIFITILSIGVGFAYLTSNLTITGNTSVSGNKWSVYFTNVQISAGSVEASVAPTVNDADATSLEYTVNLDKPGDYYEFTVDAVNDGTINAMIESIVMTNLNEDVEKYLDYSATYANGNNISKNDIIRSKKSSTYKIRIEYKKNIDISDLNEDGIELTLSFEVKYTQSTLPNETDTEFTKLIKSSAVVDKNIDFKSISSDTNGKGLYIMSDTRKDEFPIYYYRGDVDNNNAMFAGFCWKIVRTTETGGTKLIYNGLPTLGYEDLKKISMADYANQANDQTYPFTFDLETKEWTSQNKRSSSTSVFTFNVSEIGDYVLNYKVSSEENSDNAIFYKDDIQIIKLSGEKRGSIDLGNLSPTNIIKITYSKDGSYNGGSDNITFSLDKSYGNKTEVCNNTGGASQIQSTYANYSKTSPSYGGYMYGNAYPYSTKSTSSSDKYGNSFIYENGMYTLNDINDGIDANHHYTCFNSTGTCENIFYVFTCYTTMAYYITLKDGKSVENAIEEMHTNNYDSNLKRVVDSWFSNTFESYFTNQSKDYNNYLEDTIWCNDRTTYSLGGWNPNGGIVTHGSELWYSTYGKRATGTPTLKCSNKNDSFTVNESINGNGALTYPVGLLTADETILAGAQTNTNRYYYLYTGIYWWTMSPFGFDNVNGFRAGIAGINGDNGYISLGAQDVSTYGGVRPSISIKPNVKISSGGNGTSSKPYKFIVE